MGFGQGFRPGKGDTAGDSSIDGDLSVTGDTTLGNASSDATTARGSLDISDADGATYGLKLASTLVTATAAELNILDGVTATAAELNILDGDTAATATTVADADRVVLNDAGTMKQVAMTDLNTYFESEIDALSNLATVGTITSGVWQGTAIADAYISSAVTWSAKQGQADVLDDLATLGANAADSEFLVGTAAGALAWESGATVRTSLNVDVAGTDNSTDVTIAAGLDYITMVGQEITLDTIDIGDDTNLAAGTGLTLTGDTLSVDAAQTQITSVGTLTGLTVNGALTGTPETITGADGANALSTSTLVSILDTSSGEAILSLAAGIAGQIKIITMSTGVNDATIDNATVNVSEQILWDSAGESVTLCYDGSKWNIVGHYGVTIS